VTSRRLTRIRAFLDAECDAALRTAAIVAAGVKLGEWSDVEYAIHKRAILRSTQALEDIVSLPTHAEVANDAATRAKQKAIKRPR
jgi:hypothetical protein